MLQLRRGGKRDGENIFLHPALICWQENHPTDWAWYLCNNDPFQNYYKFISAGGK